MGNNPSMASLTHHRVLLARSSRAADYTSPSPLTPFLPATMPDLAATTASARKPAAETSGGSFRPVSPPAPPEAGATGGFGKRIGDGTTEAVERLSTTAGTIPHSVTAISIGRW